MALPKIPINVKSLETAGKVFENESASDLLVEVLIDESAEDELVTLTRKVLEVRPDTAEITISSFGEAIPSYDKEASFTVVIAGTSPSLPRLMEIALWSDINCVFITQDAAALLTSVPEEDAVEIAMNIIEVDVQKPQEEFEDALAAWCVARLPEIRIGLGAAFPFMRRAIALDLTLQTSLENAVIAAVFFLPGADLPVLTLNQCKLLYQIAVINEVPIKRERLADAAVVVAAAFGLRGLTRFVLGRLGPLGWLVRGTISLGATLAVGHVAQMLYSRGGGIVELAKEKFDSAPEEQEQDNTHVPLEREESPTDTPEAATAQNGVA